MNRENDTKREALCDYADKNGVRYLEGWIQGRIGKMLLNFDDQHMNESEDRIKKELVRFIKKDRADLTSAKESLANAKGDR